MVAVRGDDFGADATLAKVDNDFIKISVALYPEKNREMVKSDFVNRHKLLDDEVQSLIDEAPTKEIGEIIVECIFQEAAVDCTGTIKGILAGNSRSGNFVELNNGDVMVIADALRRTIWLDVLKHFADRMEKLRVSAEEPSELNK